MTGRPDIEGESPGRSVFPAMRVVAALAFAALLPLTILAALIVWASVGRPILFRQRRSGLGGVPFEILKLRTMREAFSPDGAPLPDAERETAATRALRRFRLDELPQLLSIARGDMALVGPRPLLPETVARFGALGVLRGSVRPGLTGWAQVNGNTRLSEAEKLALDLWYVRHKSAALDLRILFMTARTILFGERVDRANLSVAEAEAASVGALA